MAGMSKTTIDSVEGNALYAFEDALEEIGRLLGVYDSAKAAGPARPRQRREKLRGPEQTLQRLLKDPERDRSELLTEHFATIASEHTAVTSFRRDVLAGGTLTDDEAEAFVASPAYRYLSRADLEAVRMPLVGVKSWERWKKLRADTLPDGRVITGRDVKLECAWGRKKWNDVRYVPILGDLSAATRSLQWEPGKRSQEPIHILPGCLLDDLKKAANALTWLLWWPEAKAARYVLTGEFPVSPAIDITTTQRQERGLTQGRIVLTIAPWVSAKSVEAVYAYFQRQMVGGRTRSIGSRSLERFRFVEREMRRGKPTWSALHARWKLKKPTRAKASYSNFQKDYARTRRALLQPLYATGEPFRRDAPQKRD
jgi:hypothetical protein